MWRSRRLSPDRQKVLHLYAAELRFRYSNKKNGDIFGTVIEGSWGATCGLWLRWPFRDGGSPEQQSFVPSLPGQKPPVRAIVRQKGRARAFYY
jgi:hypothetical protein